MKIILLIILFGFISSIQAGLDFPLTPAQEDAIATLPSNMVHRYIHNIRRQYMIDEAYIKSHSTTAYREGAGIVVAHDYGMGYNRMISNPFYPQYFGY